MRPQPQPMSSTVASAGRCCASSWYYASPATTKFSRLGAPTLLMSDGGGQGITPFHVPYDGCVWSASLDWTSAIEMPPVGHAVVARPRAGAGPGFVPTSMKRFVAAYGSGTERRIVAEGWASV